MFCPECGQQSADDVKFCVKCGKKFVENIASTSSSLASQDQKQSTGKVPQDSDKEYRSLSGSSSTHIHDEELKDSGTVTAMSVVGFVFGLIGMLGSFIPCIGAWAFYVGIPAAIISAIGLGIAYSQHAKRTFAIVAVTISLIGVVISGWQYFSIISAGKEAKREIDNWMQKSKPAPKQSQEQVQAPVQVPPSVTQIPSNSMTPVKTLTMNHPLDGRDDAIIKKVQFFDSATEITIQATKNIRGICWRLEGPNAPFLQTDQKRGTVNFFV